MANLTIKEAYEAVFNESGAIKPCGREAGRKLIEVCEAKEPTTYFGDKKTGKICLSNIDVIQRLYYED